MAVTASIVSVGTSATLLNATDTATTTVMTGQSVLVRNNGAATVYLGGSAVTTATGYPLAIGAEISVSLGAGEELYGRVASGTVDCNVIATGI